ncbi:hypothetical protein [Okeania sp. SIO2B3]|uniref:hypothetical protein n=1 Tax=Okeania sp. SIO2B3 TaxID=2607784 RepID=UPI0013C12137|nr:hypothetical protein [Okeania sp. SIO2B3]NET40593.1 hypothetical protein [Okeania sp. SIO2B3]
MERIEIELPQHSVDGIKEAIEGGICSGLEYEITGVKNAVSEGVKSGIDTNLNGREHRIFEVFKIIFKEKYECSEVDLEYAVGWMTKQAIRVVDRFEEEMSNEIEQGTNNK